MGGLERWADLSCGGRHCRGGAGVRAVSRLRVRHHGTTSTNSGQDLHESELGADPVGVHLPVRERCLEGNGQDRRAWVRALLNTFIEKLIPLYSPGQVVTATTVAAPPMLAHGDRQVVLAQDNTYRTGTGAATRTVMNVFVQVGRGIVYIDPATDQRDSRDPAGSIEQALTAAADDLAKALATNPSG